MSNPPELELGSGSGSEPEPEPLPSQVENEYDIVASTVTVYQCSPDAEPTVCGAPSVVPVTALSQVSSPLDGPGGSVAGASVAGVVKA